MTQDTVEPQAYGDATLVRHLMAVARPYRLHVGGVALLTLLATPLALLQPVPLKIVVDSVLGDQPVSGPLLSSLPDDPLVILAVAALGVVLIALLRQGQSLVTWLYSTWVGERLVLLFRSEVFRHVQRMSLAFHDQRGAADLAYRIQYDANSVRDVLIDGLLPLVGSVLTVAGMIYVTAVIDARLAVIALAVAPVMFLLARQSRSPLRRRWNRVYDQRSKALAVVQETLAGMRVVKAFGQEEREEGRFHSRSNDAVRGHMRAITAEGGVKLLVGVTAALGTAAVLVVGTLAVQAGTLSLGDLLIVMSYMTMLFAPLSEISAKIADLQSSLSAAQRAFSVLDEAPDVVERPGALPLGQAHGDFRLEGVSFGYDPGQPVLQDVSLVVEPGTWLGISGRTGAGKTTLVSLLARFYDPVDGRILLDGTDLRDLRLDDLRRQFGVVLQEPVLFPTSIAENIAYARPEATMEEIEAAAEAAGAADFIHDLPDGYDTLVGERGLRMSGGERQRISIARAFLRDAPILILDEPTSSVDVETEGRIMDAMWRLMEGRTCFMIAHRLSTLERCHRVVRVEGGRVVERVPVEAPDPLEPVAVRA